jgi:NAD(P)-dependent dehydrogenase (short-subunit alcohol dehydrogenase family)
MLPEEAGLTQYFEGKAAFVTGGGSGIGEAIALALANSGCDVVIADINPNSAEAVASQIRAKGRKALALALDVSDENAFDRAAAIVEDALGRVDVLVNNAGVAAGPTPFHDTPLPDLKWVFAVNVFGVFNGIKSLLPLMLKHGEGGYIVNTGSPAGFVVTPKTDQNSGAAYSASKHAVVAMTEAWRLSLGPLGIHVCLLVPGAVRTEFAMAIERRLGDEKAPELVDRLKEALDAGASPDDIAAQTIKGLQTKAPFIFTSPSTHGLINKRCEEILAAAGGYC